MSENFKTDQPVPLNGGPLCVRDTARELDEAKTVLKASFKGAVRGNLVLVACASVFTVRAGRHLWETRGRQMWNRAGVFIGDAYRAMLNDAFGAKVQERTEVWAPPALPPGTDPDRPIPIPESKTESTEPETIEPCDRP